MHFFNTNIKTDLIQLYKKNKEKLFVFLCFLLVCVIMQIFNIPCIIKYTTGIECLGCGMTRALMSAFVLNFKKAFGYHPMFWSVPFLFLYFLKDGYLFKNKILNMSFGLLIALGFIVNWFIKIF